MANASRTNKYTHLVYVVLGSPSTPTNKIVYIACEEDPPITTSHAREKEGGTSNRKPPREETRRDRGAEIGRTGGWLAAGPSQKAEETIQRSHHKGGGDDVTITHQSRNEFLSSY